MGEETISFVVLFVDDLIRLVVRYVFMLLCLSVFNSECSVRIERNNRVASDGRVTGSARRPRILLTSYQCEVDGDASVRLENQTNLPAKKPCVLITNLGSPADPSPGSVRTYLREFLSDRRVIETNPLLWKPILEGIILRVRPRQSGEKYSMIWTENGSPLVHYTKEQANYLNEVLGDRVHVEWAMRYGSPSIPEVMEKIYRAGYRRLLVVPLYPQYSQTVGGTAMDSVWKWALNSRDQFDLRVLRSFPEHPKYVEAVATAVENEWAKKGRPNFAQGDKILFSFHSIPKAMSDDGDPYASECEATTKQLADRLGIGADQLVLTYQSVFGPAEWLKPATIDTVAEVAEAGANRVDVVCPGFVSDCLETLEEIEMQNREAFEKAGGREFNYIPWGNDNEPWLQALATIVEESLAGWA